MRKPLQPSDIFYPSDLAVMQMVFDNHCREFGYAQRSPAAEDIADAVVTLFKMGYTDEEGLADAMAGRELIRKTG